LDLSALQSSAFELVLVLVRFSQAQIEFGAEFAVEVLQRQSRP